MDSALMPAAPTDDMSWLLDGKEEKDHLGPELPDDYRELPKPRKADTLGIADDLVSDHGLRLGRTWEMGEVYDGDRPGYFSDDQDDIEDDIVETMPLQTLKQMYKFRCGLIAMHEPYARLLARDSIDGAEAMAVESLVSFDFQCEERQYAREQGASLRYQEAAHLQQYGMLVGLDELDPDDPDCGLAMSLIDPTTVFPVWGGRAGVTEVYRVYDDTSENIVGTFGGRPGTREYARVENAVRKLTGKDGSGRSRRGELHSVTQLHNRDWVHVIIDSEKELLTRKHEYPGKLPYTIVAGNFGGPAGTSGRTSRDPTTLQSDWGEVRVSDSAVDIARKIQPYDWQNVRTHRIAEAVAGRQLTMFKWALDPHKIWEYDPITKSAIPDDVRLLPGETTRVPIPGKLSIVTPVIDPLAMGGVNMALQANAQSGVLAQLQSGAVPPQTSGSALNAMLELGGANDTILIDLIQLFKRLRAEWRLELRRDYGGMLGRPRDRGVIRVPADPKHATPFSIVKPETIERTGTQLEITLHHWRPDVATAQYLSTLRNPSGATGMPLISDETARRTLRITADPDREGERIQFEQLAAMPPILQQNTLALLEQQLDQALAEGDDESAERAMIAIAELQFMHDQAVMSGQAAGPPQPPGGPQQHPPPPPQTPVLPGTSLPEQGIPVGNQGGRPDGAVQTPDAAGQALTPLTPRTQ